MFTNKYYASTLGTQGRFLNSCAVRKKPCKLLVRRTVFVLLMFRYVVERSIPDNAGLSNCPVITSPVNARRIVTSGTIYYVAEVMNSRTAKTNAPKYCST